LVGLLSQVRPMAILVASITAVYTNATAVQQLELGLLVWWLVFLVGLLSGEGSTHSMLHRIPYVASVDDGRACARVCVRFSLLLSFSVSLSVCVWA
jgi:hypothetical protein